MDANHLNQTYDITTLNDKTNDMTAVTTLRHALIYKRVCLSYVVSRS
jgi:hypothetical protein